MHHALFLTAAQRCRSVDRGVTDGWRGEGVNVGKRRGRSACVRGKCTCVMWQEEWKGFRETLWKQLRPFSPLITHSSHPLCKEPTSHWHNDMIWERIAFYLISIFSFFLHLFFLSLSSLSLSLSLFLLLSLSSLSFFRCLNRSGPKR